MAKSGNQSPSTGIALADAKPSISKDTSISFGSERVATFRSVGDKVPGIVF